MIYVLVNGNNFDTNVFNIESYCLDYKVILFSKDDNLVIQHEYINVPSNFVSNLICSHVGYLIANKTDVTDKYIILDKDAFSYAETTYYWGSLKNKISVCFDVNELNTTLASIILSGFCDDELLSYIFKGFTYTEIRSLLRIENSKGFVTLLNIMLLSKNISPNILKYIILLANKSIDNFKSLLEKERIDKYNKFKEACNNNLINEE